MRWDPRPWLLEARSVSLTSTMLHARAVRIRDPSKIGGRQVLEVIWLSAREVLDSRGHPTLEVGVELLTGDRGHAGVPAGASTGSMEARELRDNDPDRYGELGVQHAIENVSGEIAHLLRGHKFVDLAELDESLIHLDGTLNKERL